MVNNNVILVDAPEESRIKRLIDRDAISRDEAIAKINRQVDADERKTMIERNINLAGWGRYWEFYNDKDDLDCAPIAADILDKWNAGVIDALSQPVGGQ